MKPINAIKTKDYKVTVITAVYNDENHIQETLECIKKQDYKNIEHIIIDGASTDNTVKILKEQSKFICKFISEPDKGIADAWNKGLKLSRGDVIFLLNCGDYYPSDYISKAILNFSDNKTIYYGSTYFFDEKLTLLNKVDKVFNPKSKNLNSFGFLHTSCFMSKEVYEITGPFNTDYKIAIDTDFLLRSINKGIQFKKVDLTNYMRLGGISDIKPTKARKEFMSSLEKNNFKTPKLSFKLYFKILLTRILGKKRIFYIKNQIRFFILFFMNFFLRFFSIPVTTKWITSAFGAEIGHHSYLHNISFLGLKFKNLKIGDNVTINNNSLLDIRDKIILGNNIMIGHDVKIYTAGHDIRKPFFDGTSNPVKIKDHSVIFPSTIIYPGITIGEGAVIYPGSVVVKDVEGYSIMGGNPALKIGTRPKDIKYRLNYPYLFST